jgi:hypothetical protein
MIELRRRRLQLQTNFSTIPQRFDHKEVSSLLRQNSHFLIYPNSAFDPRNQDTFANSLSLSLVSSQLKMGSVVLPHLRTGWHVDQAIMNEEERLVVIRFGRDYEPDCMRQDEVLYKIADRVKNFAVLYGQFPRNQDSYMQDKC